MNKVMLLIVAFALVTCAKQKEEITLQGNWQLTSLKGNTLELSSPIYLEFGIDGKVTGHAGCNNLTGNYTVEQGTIKFSDIATTRSTCPQIQVETEVLSILENANMFSINEGKLVLKSFDSTVLASFKEIEYSEIINKYWKLITLNGSEVTISENQEREQHFILKNDGIVTGFAGCNQLNGQYTIDEGNRINFNQNLAVTLKACTSLEIDESSFLKVFELADNYTLRNDTLSLNVGKRAPLAVFEAIYF